MPGHSAGAAFHLAALLIAQICPMFSLLAPCQPAASPPSVSRYFELGTLVTAGRSIAVRGVDEDDTHERLGAFGEVLVEAAGALEGQWSSRPLLSRSQSSNLVDRWTVIVSRKKLELIWRVTKSLLMNITVPFIPTHICFGETPAAVIVTVAVLFDGEGLMGPVAAARTKRRCEADCHQSRFHPKPVPLFHLFFSTARKPPPTIAAETVTRGCRTVCTADARSSFDQP